VLSSEVTLVLPCGSAERLRFWATRSSTVETNGTTDDWLPFSALPAAYSAALLFALQLPAKHRARPASIAGLGATPGGQTCAGCAAVPSEPGIVLDSELANAS
jgi:hypothetical protein